MASNNKNRAALLFLGGAAIIASGAIYGIFNILSSLRSEARKAEKPVETVTVVAARRTLYQGVQITNDDLYVVQIPPEYLPRTRDPITDDILVAEVFNSRERVVGQIPREKILAKEFIRPERLADGANGVGLNAVIPPGMRALSVDLRDADALSGFLQPGNYVDILVTMKDELGDDRTETMLQVVPVLGVNSRARNESEDEVATRGRQRPSVTFLVTPKQAEEIAFADELGDISLALRNVQDVNYQHLSGKSMTDLVARLKPQEKTITRVSRPARVASPTPAPTRASTTITVIRGDQRSEVSAGD